MAQDDQLAEAFALITAQRIDANVIGGVGTEVKYVDIARDVINAAAIEFISYLVRGCKGNSE